MKSSPLKPSQLIQMNQVYLFQDKWFFMSFDSCLEGPFNSVEDAKHKIASNQILYGSNNYQRERCFVQK